MTQENGNNSIISWVIQLLAKCMNERMYGEIVISLKNGMPTNVKTVESHKPPEM